MSPARRAVARPFSGWLRLLRVGSRDCSIWSVAHNAHGPKSLESAIGAELSPLDLPHMSSVGINLRVTWASRTVDSTRTLAR